MRENCRQTNLSTDSHPKSRSKHQDILLVGAISGLVILAAFSVYLLTLSPSITWSHNGMDSGDFATAAACKGVPHPTGYPTYLVLADLFIRLPWGDPAYRLNLLSAFAGALSAGLIVLLIAVIISNTVEISPKKSSINPALLTSVVSAGFVFVFNPLVWSQAVIAEVYTLHILFVLVLMFVGVWHPRRQSYRLILITFCVFGLGLGNHLSLLLILPALVTLLYRPRDTRPIRSVLVSILGTGIGISIYLVIPERASQIPPVNWGGASNWSGFQWLVTGQVYHELFWALPIAYLPLRVTAWIRYLFVGLSGWGLPIAIWGMIDLLKHSRRLAVGTLLIFVLYSIYAITYDTTDSYVYLIPASAMTILWMGYGLHSIIQLILQRQRFEIGLRLIVFGILIGLSLIGLPWHWAAMNLSNDTEAIDYAMDVIQTVESGSIILVEGDAHTFSLWYVRYGLKLRKDIAIVNDALLQFDWYRTILSKYHADIMDAGRVRDLTTLLEANIGERPVYFSDKPEALIPGQTVIPFGQLWRVEKSTHTIFYTTPYKIYSPIQPPRARRYPRLQPDLHVHPRYIYLPNLNQIST